MNVFGPASLLDLVKGLRSAFGFHENDDGTQHAVVKEPKLFRFPRNPKLNKRSTWTKTNDQWGQVENGIDWEHHPHNKFIDWAEKAVFYFWDDNKVALVACPAIQDFC